MKSKGTKKGFMDGYKVYDVESDGYGSSFEWKQAFFNRMDPNEAAKILDNDDPYSILQIKHGATKEMIRKAFRRLAMIYHPDKNPDNEDWSKQMMQKLNAAYSILI